MLTETYLTLVPTVTLYYMSTGGQQPPAGRGDAGLSARETSPSELSAEQALLSASDADSDDGVAVVMNMLEAERATIAPLPPPDVDRLLAGWHAAEWGCGESMRGRDSKREEEEEVVVEPWGYGEDCVVADVMTRVDPEGQREEVRRRLPGRRWNEVRERFRELCGDVEPTCPPEEEREESKWGRMRRWGSVRGKEERRFKPRCGIVKKFKRWR